MAFLSCLFFSRSQYKKRFRRNASSHIHSTTLSCQRLSVCLDRFGSTTQMHQPNPCVNARGTSRQTKAKKNRSRLRHIPFSCLVQCRPGYSPSARCTVYSCHGSAGCRTGNTPTSFGNAGRIGRLPSAANPTNSGFSSVLFHFYSSPRECFLPFASP